MRTSWDLPAIHAAITQAAIDPSCWTPAMDRIAAAIPDISALAQHFMGARFVSGGALGLLAGSLTTVEEQRALLAFHHG
jgi:hypothetical protein